MYRHLKLEARGELALVRIDRPPANALDLELLEEGHRVLAELARDGPAAVVLTGREGFFSAGVDLKLAPTLDRDGQRELLTGINRLFAGWYGFPRPVVCAVNGHAVAGGTILALCGDYRVGSTEGRLGLTELRTGVPYPAVALAVVRAELAPGAARRLVLGADLVDPQQALELGVLDELAEPGALLDRAFEVAGELAALPPSAYPLVKQQLRGEAVAAMERVLDEDSDPLRDSWFGEETGAAAAGILAQDRRERRS
jgi:enoyl-CoA hydratase/carnithine racemase